jgi:hypothetical protein
MAHRPGIARLDDAVPAKRVAAPSAIKSPYRRLAAANLSDLTHQRAFC